MKQSNAFLLNHCMTNSQRLETVRTAISCWLARQSDSSDTPMVESFLIRDEFFCGRRFCTSSHHATWFIEEDELKIHSVNGPLCLSIRGEEIDELASDRLPTAVPELDSEAPAETRTEDEDQPNVLPMPAFGQQDEDESGEEIRRAA